jgi:hypothetical protein
MVTRCLRAASPENPSNVSYVGAFLPFEVVVGNDRESPSLLKNSDLRRRLNSLECF